MRFIRITVNPKQMDGMPCIRGLRIPVATVVAMVADGMTENEILAAYPGLERDDISETLHYAAEAVRERALRSSGLKRRIEIYSDVWCQNDEEQQKPNQPHSCQQA